MSSPYAELQEPPAYIPTDAVLEVEPALERKENTAGPTPAYGATATNGNDEPDESAPKSPYLREYKMVSNLVPTFVLYLVFVTALLYPILFPIAIVPSIHMIDTVRLALLCVQTAFALISAMVTFIAVGAEPSQRRRLIEVSAWVFISLGLSITTIVLGMLPASGFGFDNIAVLIVGIIAAVFGFCQQLVLLNALGGWVPEWVMSVGMLRCFCCFAVAFGNNGIPTRTRTRC